MQSKALCVIFTLFISFFGTNVWAQDGGSSGIIEDSIKDVTTVVALGAGGAILGLSTLSFTEEPKDHLKNVLVGGAIGVIIGVGYVAYKQATGSTDDLRSQYRPSKEFSTGSRVAWHSSEKNFEFQSAPLSVMTQFEF